MIEFSKRCQSYVSNTTIERGGTNEERLYDRIHKSKIWYVGRRIRCLNVAGQAKNDFFYMIR